MSHESFNIRCEVRADKFFRTRLPKMYEECSDLMQEYRIKVWKHQDSILAHPSPESCIQEIASSVWKDYLRDMSRNKRARELRQCEMYHNPEVMFDDDAYVHLAESVPTKVESDTSHVVELIDEILKEDQATIVKLRYVDGLEYDDIAEIMGVDRSTVYWKHQRAIQALGKKCTKEQILAHC